MVLYLEVVQQEVKVQVQVQVVRVPDLVMCGAVLVVVLVHP